ncbi:hypothetical protein PR048_016092 [Dryococelus australis]|uniref:Uncharacterized protein n=1 Tax=Dryococelus australis TaxID=614101 RepID=A0ABQ9HIS2_9NEOP|nr:hypothetical protein PR048_016092 [Dryococelus australis]
MSCVMNPVITVVNVIRSHGLKHRQFKSFLVEVESLSPVLPYYTAVVRWLSYGKILSREKTILSVIFTHMAKLFVRNCFFLNNKFNRKLLHTLSAARHWNVNKIQNFDFCFLEKFLEQFSDRFSDLDAHFKAIRIFQNPFSCETDVQPSLQLKLIDLQAK